MADMDRTDDVVVATGLLAVDSTGDKFRMTMPRAMKLVKSYAITEAATTGTGTVTVESASGDLSDTIAVTGAAADTIIEVDHRDEANNAFAEGTRLVLEVTGAATAGDAYFTLVLRPL